MIKLAIYCRTSRDNGETHDSIETQTEIGIKYAEKNGLPYEVYIDEGISGTGDFFKRPSFVKMVSEIDDELISHVWVLDDSRLEREPSVKFFCRELFIKKKINYYINTSGIVDFDDFNQELIGNILSVTNKHFVKLTAYKVKLKLEKNVSNGKVHGTPAYGYTKDKDRNLIVDEKQSEIIQTIFKMSLEGNGAHTIAEYLNEKKIPTSSKINSPNGSITIKNKHTGVETKKNKSEILWSSSVVGSILKSTIYYGERKFKDKIYPAPSIISKETFDYVQLQLKKNKNYSQNGTTYNYLLKGLITCAKCGKHYVGRYRKNKPNSFYICSSKDIKRTNCGNESIEIKKIEEFVWDNVVGSTVFLQILRNEFNFDDDSEQMETSSLIKEKANIEKKLIIIQQEKEKMVLLFRKNLLNELEVEREIKDIEKKKETFRNEINDINNKLKFIQNKKEIISEYQRFQKQLHFYSDDLDFKSKKYMTNLLVNNILIDWNEEHQLYEIVVNYNYINDSMPTIEETTLDKSPYIDWNELLNGRNRQSIVQVP